MPKTERPDLQRMWQSGWLAYGLALLGGFCVAASIFPASLLFAWDGVSGTSLTDPIQHIVGQRYFIADAWRWPLLSAKNLAGGTNIGLTDSIPAMALATKLLRGLLPPGFQSIFLWLAISYTLQPVAAVYAMRGAGERRLLPCLAAACVAGCMPAMLHRYGHAALSGQFLILLALGMYFRICAGRRKWFWVVTSALLLLALLIHPYLLAMVAALLAAAPLTLLLRADRAWLGAACGIAAGLVLTGLAALALGYVGLMPEGGFGYFSMNLLQPVWPDRSTLFPAAGVPPGGPGQVYEGYNYLGAGGLLLACLGLVRARAVARHGGLLLACLALTAWALSNHVMLGTRQLVDLGAMPGFIQMLRASGRMFWPVAYVVVIAGALAGGAMGGDHPRRVVAAMVLLAAMGLQLADTTQLRQDVATAMRTAPPLPPDIAALRPLLATHGWLTILPIDGCAGERDEASLMQILLLASVTTIPVNTMYVARVRQLPLCDDAAASAPLGEGELRLFDPASAITPFPDSDRFCRELGRFTICARDVEGMAGLAPLRSWPVAVLPAGRMVAMNNTADPALFSAGWIGSEVTGTWTAGNFATLTARLDKPIAGPARLTVMAHAFAPRRGGTQDVAVTINGHATANWVVDENTGRFSADIPDDVDLSGPLRIRFAIEQPTRPKDRDHSDDPRWLGMHLVWLGIAPRDVQMP